MKNPQQTAPNSLDGWVRDATENMVVMIIVKITNERETTRRSQFCVMDFAFLFLFFYFVWMRVFCPMLMRGLLKFVCGDRKREVFWLFDDAIAIAVQRLCVEFKPIRSHSAMQ